MTYYDRKTNTALSVDYTSRDYFALREELLNRVATRVNANATGRRWTGEDPADFGVALVEAFSYMGDILNYYIDRIANESYLPTASQRQNIINLAESLGYTPTGYRAATATLEFSNSSENAVTLPEGTQVFGEVTVENSVRQLIFETINSVTVPAAVNDSPSVATVNAVHQENIALRPENAAVDANDIDGEFLGTSDGRPSQTFTLQENQVVESSIEVYVQNGDTYEPWTKAVQLTDFGPTDAVFSTSLDADNVITITFGDGISGAIPTIFSGIKAVYGAGGGQLGNITQNVITELYRIPGLNDAQVSETADVVSVTNTGVGSGGVDPESNDSIRTNAPQVLSTVNRAVSLVDYANLALTVPNVGKAKAEADIPTSVTLYISPQRNDDSLDNFPGYDTSGQNLRGEWLSLRADTAGFLEDKLPAGTTVTISPPVYVPVSLSITYTKRPQFDQTQVESALKLKLLTDFSYNRMRFQDTVSPEEIEFRLQNVEGVRYVRVTNLERVTGPNNGTSSLIGDVNEIFVFQEGNTAFNLASDDATLSALDGPAGTTLSPTFNPDFNTYNLLNVSTNQITLTVTPSDASAVATINGNPTTSPVDTPAGTTTNIPITVIAGDLTTVNVYTIIVSRA